MKFESLQNKLFENSRETDDEVNQIFDGKLCSILNRISHNYNEGKHSLED